MNLAITTSATGRAWRAIMLLVSAAALSAASTLLTAEEHGPNTGEKIDALAGAALSTRRSHLASELAAYGRESQNAMALIVAAEMQAQAGGQEVKRDKHTEGPDGPNDDKEPGEDIYTVAAMLSDARDLARNDVGLLAAIDQLASLETKGTGHPRRISGPQVHRDSVRGRHNDIYSIRFRGGEPAIVSVVGDGGTDLDLRIYDQGGNLVCSDLNYTDRSYCRWQPLREGNFRIKITNLGRVYNRYTIRTN